MEKKTRFTQHILLILLVFFVFSGCKEEDEIIVPPPPPIDVEIVSEQILQNPYQLAPLTAQIILETTHNVKASIRVTGKHGPESDVFHQFDTYSKNHEIPVLGLYADHNNEVELILTDEQGNEAKRMTYNIQTEALLPDLPQIDINIAKAIPETEKMTFVSYYGYFSNWYPQTPFMFDDFGDIRWYIDFRRDQNLSNLFYDVGIERLQNGNFYFGDSGTDRIYEMTPLGQKLRSWPMPGFGFHHNVFEKPNGNFLVTTHRDGIDTAEDHIIEIERSSGDIINVWDLRQSLDRYRLTLSDNPTDWIHVNAVIYDESDNTIIISGRYQGVIKLNENNTIKWILGCHKDWEKAGNGGDLNQFLLTPLDENGNEITDSEVLNGNENHPAFEWNWGQHAPHLMPNGNIMVFDNGYKRNFTLPERYSRAVEYKIDENAMTVRQVWSYGKERGEETFAVSVSDVDYDADLNRLTFSPGSLSNQTGKAVEINYTSQEVLFEATIIPPKSFWGITLHRTERLSLYP